MSPVAPGTVGSLVSLPFFWLLSHQGPGPYLFSLSVFFILAVYAAHEAGRHWGAADDQRIVIDEGIGLGVACFGLAPHEWLFFAVAFGAFRLFDIVKPWPVSYVDRSWKNGFGVVMDDVVAGLYAWLLVFALRFALTGPSFFR